MEPGHTQPGAVPGERERAPATSPGPRIRVAIVDDHEIVRHGLRLSLEREPDMAAVAEAASGAEAVRLAEQLQPDVMLLDVRLVDADGPDVCARVRAVSPHTSVIMLTSYQQDGLVFRSLAAGARGYVIKDVELAELKKVIRDVFRGSSVLDPRVTGPVISTATASGRGPAPRDATLMSRLSDIDLSIVRGVAAGLTNRQIGERVHLSPHTVKDRLEKICDVLGVRVRTEVVAEAMRRGLI